MIEHPSLGNLVLFIIAIPVILAGVCSVIVAFIPSRHPEAEERFGSAKRIKEERRKRDKARWLTY